MSITNQHRYRLERLEYDARRLGEGRHVFNAVAPDTGADVLYVFPAPAGGFNYRIRWANRGQAEPLERETALRMLSSEQAAP